MITLPLVWRVSVLTTIAAFPLAQDTRIPFQARLFLCVFLLTLASIGLLLGLRLSFDAPWAARVRPLVAVMVAPSAYVAVHSKRLCLPAILGSRAFLFFQRALQEREHRLYVLRVPAREQSFVQLLKKRACL